MTDFPVRERSENGRFRGDPHPALRSFVVEYWAQAPDLAAMGGISITPDCFCELICCFDDLYVIAGTRREKLPPCFLVTLFREPLRIEADGRVRCMAARLWPWSVGSFQEMGVDLRADTCNAAEAVFGPRLSLVADLLGRCDWHSLCALFDHCLSEIVARGKPRGGLIELVKPFLDGEQPRTATVAHDQRTTSRRVERQVRSLTGTSPKQLACLRRFQAVRDALWADPETDLARLAVEAGYADQPHMTRVFRRYSGQTPAQFARESTARKKGLAARDVAFLQDREPPPG